MVTDGQINRWNGVAYQAADERLLDTALLMPGSSAEPFSVRSGRRVNGAGLAVTIGTGPDSWTVSPGSGVLYSSTFAAQGGWRFEVPTAVTANFGARPGGGTSRIDLIVACIYDTDISVGSVKELKVEIVTGTPAASPVAPTQPALSRLLATVTVPASGAITVAPDTRVTVAAGGVLPVATTAERDAISTPWKGLTVYNTQTGFLETYNGTGWAPGKPPWVTLTAFATGRQTNSFGYTAAYRLWPGGRVDLRGGVKATSGNLAGGLLLTLPVEARPAQTLEFAACVSSQSPTPVARIEIAATGTVSVLLGSLTSAWVSLDGITFDLV